MPGTTSTALLSFSHEQHHETDAAKRKGGGFLIQTKFWKQSTKVNVTLVSSSCAFRTLICSWSWRFCSARSSRCSIVKRRSFSISFFHCCTSSTCNHWSRVPSYNSQWQTLSHRTATLHSKQCVTVGNVPQSAVCVRVSLVITRCLQSDCNDHMLFSSSHIQDRPNT